MLRKCILICRTEHVQTTLRDSKLRFVHVPYVLVTIKKWRENGPAGALNALVHAPKVRLVFSHRTNPNYSDGLRTQVCTCILHFGHN